MDTIYIKLNIAKSKTETDAIREAGLFFEYIAEAVGLSRSNIKEIDESNFLAEIKNIKNRFLK